MEKTKSIQPEISLRQKIILVIFGLSLFLILLEIGLRLGGFIISSPQRHRNMVSIQQKGTYRIMCLGESTTAGQYPPFLEETLNQRNIGIKFSVIDEGIRGINTSFILDKLESNLDAYHPDMVITMMGVNEGGRPHMPHETVSDSKAINFLKSFRIYKLTRLLWLHIVTRLKELTSDKLSKYTTQLKLLLQKGELQQVAAEKKAIELNPKNVEVYFELGRFYQNQGKLSEAEASFKKAIELNPKNIEVYGALKVLYIEMGNSRLAREYDKKAKELGLNYYRPMTIANYHKLKAILDKRGIVYVCMQYPMRNLGPLKKIFQDNEEGIIFVDNEKVFKEAVKKASYKEYFVDIFSGDFGHCTDKGNRLLAENIANVILKEVFNK